jgi:hypothetical protein
VAGLPACFLGNQGIRDAIFLPESVISKFHAAMQVVINKCGKSFPHF